MYKTGGTLIFKYLFLAIILSGIMPSLHSSTIQEEDSSIYRPRNLNAEELVRGERLFYGLVYMDNRSVDCASCHNTRESDTLNWNPDGYEISRKYLNRSAEDLSRVLLKPSGKKLSEVHRDFQLSPEDIIMIKGFMDQFAGMGMKKHKPVITNLLLFILAAVLFLFSVTDLIITKIVKRPWLHFLILTVTGVFLTYTLVVEAIAIGRSKGYSPFQPIKFSHAVHAGQNGTDCLYCHSYAPYSKSAGIPSENVCMNCHLLVRSGTRSGVTEISKVISAYENIRPVEWTKVYNLPDHVFFSHAQHVGAGSVSCEECHGNVKEMDVIVQVTDLSMGWCIDCHRTRALDLHDNNFYSQYEELKAKAEKESINNVTIEMFGGTECMKCHY